MLLTLAFTPLFANLRKYLGSTSLNTVVIYEPSDKGNYQGKWFLRFEEYRVFGQKMIDMLMCTPYRNTFDKQMELTKDNLVSRSKEIQFSTQIENADNETIINIFEGLCNLYYEYYKLVSITESLQWQIEHIITNYIKANFKKNSDEILNSLFTIKEKTFAIEILEDLKDMLEKYSKDIETGIYSKELLQRCEEHSNKYYWKKNNYFATTYITAEDVLNELLTTKEINIKSKEKILTKKEKIYSELSPYYKGIVDLFSVAAMMADTRKSTVMTANSAFDKLFKIVADRHNITLDEIRLLIPQELKYFVESPEEYKERLVARKKMFMVLQTDFPMVDDLIDIPINNEENSLLNWNLSPMDEPYIAEGEEVENIINKLDVRFNWLKHSIEEIKTLNGIATYYNTNEHILTGKVRIVRHPKTEKLENDEILVAPTTTPDYIDYIHKCKAIITDYGGQTSHAAIISREMKKPCIIGTKFATSILKDGDEVKVDFEKGTIEII